MQLCLRRVLCLPALMALLLAGCASEPDPPLPDVESVTWHADIAPLMAEHCVVCHTEGGVGGFSLSSFDEAKVLATWLSNTVRTGAMPPWSLDSSDCDAPGPFLHERGLSEEEIDLLDEWADSGTVEGDSSTATAIPAPVDRSLAGANQDLLRGAGWTASSVVDSQEYRCFVLDPEVEETSWLTGLQVLPDALEVLHHVFAYRVPAERVEEVEAQVGSDGSFDCFPQMGFGGLDPLTGWLPDTMPMEFPAGAGVAFEPGSRILLQVHYHTWLIGASDATSLSLRWAPSDPGRSARIQVFGNGAAPPALQPGPDDPPLGPEFLIPRFAYDHTESYRIPVGEEELPQRVWGLAPRMNYVGKAVRVSLEKASGETVCLGEVGPWSLDTMRFYRYDLALEDMPLMEPGDVLVLECTYDNTTGNDDLRDVLARYGVKSPQDTPLGEGPLDEMCMVALGLVEE
ncbi:MAG: cytochrome c [Myxococcota bacterium]|nr:cytochrome c [Myxococcota bacterium]